MNERIIQRVLTSGLAPFIADPGLLETLFQGEHGLSPAETALLRAYFEFSPDEGQPGGPPNIIHGYPRGTGPFPCWAIILLADRSQQRLLGDDAGTHGDFADATDLAGDPAFELTKITSFTIAIDVYVPDLPDVLLYYYHLLRHILFQSVGTLQAAPNYLQQIEFTGADLAPNAQYLPDNLWLRRLTMTFITEEAAWEARDNAPQTMTLDGAFINNDVGDANGQIEPYEE